MSWPAANATRKGRPRRARGRWKCRWREDGDLRQIGAETVSARGAQRLERGDGLALGGKVAGHCIGDADAAHQERGQPHQVRYWAMRRTLRSN